MCSSFFNAIKCESCVKDLTGFVSEINYFKGEKILDTEIINGKLEDLRMKTWPEISRMFRFVPGIVITDLANNHPNGKIYAYKTPSAEGIDDFFNVVLCSYECAYKFSCEKNIILYFHDLQNPELLRKITPHTVEINTSLNNPIYRPLA